MLCLFDFENSLLEVLMNDTDGLPPLIRATVKAAADRSRELANG